MKRTYRDSSSKANIETTRMKNSLMNACTVTELKIDRNDCRMSRSEKKNEPLRKHAMIRGRSHEQTNKTAVSQKGTTSFSSNSCNFLGGGDPTRISVDSKICSSSQATQNQVSAPCVPKVRPALTSNAANARRNRTSNNGPMRAPFVAGGRGIGVPPQEGGTRSCVPKVATNISEQEHNRNRGPSSHGYPDRDHSLNRSTGMRVSNKLSNSSMRGVSPTSKRNEPGLKSTIPASKPSIADAKRYVPKRSSSIGPNSKDNNLHSSQNIKSYTQNQSQSQSTGNLNIDDKKGQRSRGPPSRTQEKPWLKKGSRAGQSFPTIEIFAPERPHANKNPRNSINTDILPVDLTRDTARQFDTRNETSHVPAGKRTVEVNDAEETSRNGDTLPPTRSQNFDGENMKNILYFSEVNEPENKHNRKSTNKLKKLEKSAEELKYDVVQPDPEYLRSRRAGSFGGASTRYIFSGSPDEEDEGPNDQFINDFDDEDHQAKLHNKSAAPLRGNNTKTVIYDNPHKQSSTKTKVKFIRGKNKSITGYDDTYDEEDQQASLRANRSACLGGDGMKNVMSDDHMKRCKGKRDNFSKVGENIALIREMNENSDEEDQLAALHANRNACLGGDSMRNVMCDDHLKPRKGRRDNFSKVGENVIAIKEYNNDSDEEDELAALRANRNACLGGDSMRNVLCDDHLKVNKGKKDNFSKVGENIALIRECNDDSDEEGQLATLRANRNACLGGDSMRNVLCDDHLKVRKGKKDNFSKVGENITLIKEYNEDSDEDGQLAALRANRNACLGGDSMRNVLCDDHLKVRKGKKDNFSKVGENITSIKEYNDDSDEDDQLAALRANRSACLGGDNMRNVLCDDHLKVRKGKKDNFSKVGENIASIKECNDDFDEEDQLAALRANRNACLGGDSMRNVLCDDHLKARKGKKENFSKVGENIGLIKQYNNDSDEEDQLAALRANRSACLGGDSMRNVMCDDHLKPRKGRKDNYSKVGENVISIKAVNNRSEDVKLRAGKKDNSSRDVENVRLLNENKGDSDEDQLATLRANRSACLGGSSMKSLMSHDHMKPRKGRKDNFSKVGENIIPMTVSGHFTEDTGEVMKSNRAASMSGSEMGHLLYSQKISPPSSRSRNRAPLTKSIRSSSVSGTFNVDTEEAMKTNRAASMRGSNMRNILYGQNPSGPPSHSRNATQLKKSIRSSSVSGSFNMERENDVESNKSASMKGSDVRNRTQGQTSYSSAFKTNNRNSSNISTRSVSGNSTQDTDRAFRANRSAIMGGSNMKNLLYGNANSRTSNRTPLKKSIRSSSNPINGREKTVATNRSADTIEDEKTPSPRTSRARNRTCVNNSAQSSSGYNVDADESMKTNRSSSMEGSKMKNLLYGNTPTTPTSRSNNRSALKTSNYSDGNSTITMTTNAIQRRSSSTEGSVMKNLLYSRTPSPPAPIATKKAPLKKCLRGSSDNPRTNRGPMKAIHSIKTDNSDVKNCMYSDAQLPPEEDQYHEAPAESVEYSNSRRPSSSRRSQSVGPLSVSEIQEENQEILRTNRYNGIEGNKMKTLLYGENTYADQTGEADYNFDKWSNISESINTNTAEIQEYNQEILRANRFKGIGGNNMKNLLYGENATGYQPDSNYERWTSNCENPFMENSPRGYEEHHFDPMPERNTSSRKGYECKSETPTYETTPVIRHSAFEGDAMKNLLYGDYPPATATEQEYQYNDNDHEISNNNHLSNTVQGEEAIEIQAQSEYPSSTLMHQDAANEENITLDYFSVESPEEPVGVLIPYDVINQFAPECRGNIERTAVALKHGHLVDCTCGMKRRNQQEKHPCLKHIVPKNLQFYNEASKVLDILSSPFGEENDRKISTIENNLARQYPNYYNNFVQKFNRQLSEEYRTKEQQSKMGVVTSYKKLLAEEDFLSKRTKCSINEKENISGKLKNLEQDFRTACKTLKKHYPFLFVQLLQEYDFPSLALEKNVVEKNRLSLLEISQLGPRKLQEFEEMFTNEQFSE